MSKDTQWIFKLPKTTLGYQFIQGTKVRPILAYPVLLKALRNISGTLLK